MRNDPLGERLFLDKFYEVTEVIRTVYVQAGDSHYRIEINKHYLSDHFKSGSSAHLVKGEDERVRGGHQQR